MPDDSGAYQFAAVSAEPGAFSIIENTERTEKNGNFSMGTAKGELMMNDE